MADIAMIFHWSLRDLCDLTIIELAQWRARAIARLPKRPGTE